MRHLAAVVFFVALGLSSVFGDVYMHAPRGSNNRFRGDQNNNNRLFDSQNNNNGGYGWGPQMTYYEGSHLQIEWTSQHGCGEGHNNLDCEIVLQYMCGPWIRDGTEDSRVPEDVLNLPLAEQARYGYHETQGYYTDCKTRLRNRGLFQADENTNRNSDATQTRQNNNRNGLECPEERDYYPYWHPSPWRDIAILVSNTNRCWYYKQESQNVKPKGFCLDANKRTNDIQFPFNPQAYPSSELPKIWGAGAEHNNPAACVSPNEWVEVQSWGLPEPECLGHPLQRDNHLGNSDHQAMTPAYTWTLPTNVQYDDPTSPDPSATCVFRLRYNISTEDYLAWRHIDHGEEMITDQHDGQFVKNDPTLVFGETIDPLSGRKIQANFTIALDTAQTGRVFQDRSHSFLIKPRPAGIVGKIFNLNVRGKRGNIVQAYPAVEYDFTPNNLEIPQHSWVHFQWTGSDTNPQGNAGEGTQRTDRNNIVQIKQSIYGDNGRRNYFRNMQEQTMFENELDAFRMAHIDQPHVCQSITETGCCLTYEQLRIKHNNNNGEIEQDVQNCAKLNAAPNPYFNGGLVQFPTQAVYHYMSSRNNNFSNRSQKATLTVNPVLNNAALTATVAGSVAFVAAAVIAGGVYYAKTHAASSAGNVFGGIKV